MTHKEFTAWLKGVNEALGGKAPNQKMWEKVLEAADAVQGDLPVSLGKLSQWNETYPEVFRGPTSMPSSLPLIARLQPESIF